MNTEQSSKRAQKAVKELKAACAVKNEALRELRDLITDCNFDPDGIYAPLIDKALSQDCGKATL